MFTSYTNARRLSQYTGRRLSTRAEERVVNLLSAGVPIARIAKTCRMSAHTIMAIRVRRAQSIAERKAGIVASLSRLAGRGLDRLNEAMDRGELNGSLLMITTGMAVDKLLALTGDVPTPVVPAVSNLMEPANDLHRRLKELADKLNGAPSGPVTSA